MTPEQREKKRLYNKQWRLNNVQFKEHQKEYGKQYYATNKEELLDKNKQWSINNPEKRRKINQKRHYMLNFGITIEQYNEIFDKQGGCCAVCNRHQSEFKMALAVDHNHMTDGIRGLLCSNCNLILGHANDNINILQNAIQYLKVMDIHLDADGQCPLSKAGISNL